jgi:hypothetical protein
MSFEASWASKRAVRARVRASEWRKAAALEREPGRRARLNRGAAVLDRAARKLEDTATGVLEHAARGRPRGVFERDSA